MKKSLILLTLLFYCLTGLSQQYQYVPMVPDNGSATWQVITVYTHSGPPHIYLDCQQLIIEYTLSGQDTVIGGQTFKVINRKMAGKSTSVLYSSNLPCPLPDVDPFSAYSTDTYYAAIREENKRVYIAGWGITTFFDFNLEVGQGSKDYTGVVYKIDTISLNGSLRKRFIMSTFSGPDTVIEGIGSMRRGAIKVTDYTNSRDALTICHKYNNNTDYSHPQVPCTHFYPSFPATVNNDLSESMVKLSPNPFNNILNASTNITLPAYIYNSTGQIVWSGIIQNSTTIQTDSFPEGLYFMILKNESGQIIKTEKLLKE